jgi:hypothetical protein
MPIKFYKSTINHCNLMSQITLWWWNYYDPQTLVGIVKQHMPHHFGHAMASASNFIFSRAACHCIGMLVSFQTPFSWIVVSSVAQIWHRSWYHLFNWVFRVYGTNWRFLPSLWQLSWYHRFNWITLLLDSIQFGLAMTTLMISSV